MAVDTSNMTLDELDAFRFKDRIVDGENMTDFPRSFGVDYIGGSVLTTKNQHDIVRDAVISLLIQKFPDEISDADITKFVL